MQYTLIDDVLMMREDDSQEWRPAPVTHWEEGAKAITQAKGGMQPNQPEQTTKLGVKVIR